MDLKLLKPPLPGRIEPAEDANRVACSLLDCDDPIALIIAFFTIATPYCAVVFLQGGLPRVKSLLIHVQIEGRLNWNEANDYWTWPHTLRPILILTVIGIAFWAVRRRLRAPFPA